MAEDARDTLARLLAKAHYETGEPEAMVPWLTDADGFRAVAAAAAAAGVDVMGTLVQAGIVEQVGYAHPLPSGGWTRFHGSEAIHMDGCVPVFAPVAKEQPEHVHNDGCIYTFPDCDPVQGRPAAKEQP